MFGIIQFWWMCLLWVLCEYDLFIWWRGVLVEMKNEKFAKYGLYSEHIHEHLPNILYLHQHPLPLHACARPRCRSRLPPTKVGTVLLCYCKLRSSGPRRSIIIIIIIIIITITIVQKILYEQTNNKVHRKIVKCIKAVGQLCKVLKLFH